MPIVSKSVESVIVNGATSQDTMTKWENYLKEAEPHLMSLITRAAHSCVTNMTSLRAFEAAGKIPIADVHSSIISTAVMAVIALTQGANDIGLSKLDVDSIAAIGEINSDELYNLWLSGVMDDKYYDVEHMGSEVTVDDEVISIIDGNDWNTAVKNHNEHRSSKAALATKRHVVASIAKGISDKGNVLRASSPDDESIDEIVVEGVQ